MTIYNDGKCFKCGALVHVPNWIPQDIRTGPFLNSQGTYTYKYYRSMKPICQECA